MRYEDEQALMFLIRRMAWIGKCRRCDIEKAFGKRPSSRMTRIMQQACVRWPRFIRSLGRAGLSRIHLARIPDEAGIGEMLAAMSQGGGPDVTGIFENEIDVFVPKNRARMAATKTASELILKSLIKKNDESIINIFYVGLKVGERATWREVVTRSLEYTGSQWRLHAQDLADGPDAELKSYVMARILDASPGRPRDRRVALLKKKSWVRKQTILRVVLSDRLTEDQVEAIRNEFDIMPKGRMILPSHTVHDFKRLYAQKKPDDSIVFPQFLDVSEVE